MRWWQRLLHRKAAEDRLERELAFHLEQHAADLIDRGLSPEEAHRQARLSIGGADQVKEGCRDARGTMWVEELAQDTRFALRALRLRPAFAATVLLTLALGSGATAIMFAVVHAVLLKPLPYPDAHRLLSLRGETKNYGDRWGFSYPDYVDCRRASRSLSMAAWRYGGGTVSGPGDAEYVDGRYISSELFSVLGVALAAGRGFSPDDDRPGAPPVAIISDRLWQNRFARSASAVGRPLTFEGKAYTVVGIAPAAFRFFGDADVFTPLGQSTDPRMQNREARFLQVVARLKPGIEPVQAEQELRLIAGQLEAQYPKSNEGRTFVARPLNAQLVRDVRSTLWFLLGMAGVVLLIASANVASLLLARAVSRDREIAMRVALGAGKARLFRQAMTESILLALLGGMAGVGIATFGLKPFLLLWPGGLPRADEIRIDNWILLVATATSILAGLLFGLAPALRAPATEVDGRLRSTGRTVTGSPHRLHRTFVVSEIALAFVLLAAAGLLGRTLLRLSSLDPGVNLSNVLISRLALAPSSNTPPLIRAAFNDILLHAAQVPGVQAVALSDTIPMRVGGNELGYWTSAAAPPQEKTPLALALGVTPQYVNAMGIPLLQGRFLNDRDVLGSQSVVVIDQVLAQHAFGADNPVGKRLYLSALGAATVVGVVGHVRHWGLARDDHAVVRAQVYYPLAQVPDRILPLFASIMSITVRTATSPEAIVEPLRNQLRTTAAGEQVLYETRTMEQLASESLARHRFILLLLSVFGGLAMVLACVGVFGVLTYFANERVPEIGLRMALGASVANVFQLVFRQSLIMIAAGAGIGFAGALLVERLLVRTLHGVERGDLLSFVGVNCLLLAAALAAGVIPAWRASRIDPLAALRR